ncbi:MAG TPA: GSCFA domain-containing protein [Candidatus Baltobacteraceae bacterium]|nr:GSCFA domain-containing protein [Candidatus Baltobacteraceae bacterium]
MSALPADRVDPQGARAGWRFDRRTAIASAGSCFAARIAERLRSAGYNYLTLEPGAAYSAAYGDVTTALQLLQLAQRAAGSFRPSEPPWVRDGRYVDPFRPLATAAGFASVAALEADRTRHLAAVRRMLSEAEVLVFTLGLTETWCTRADGAALPLCPGASVGTFDPARYVYRNLSVAENVAALEAFLDIARALNPGLRLVLTVSPIPLAATMEPRHVLQASTYSKSVLRVAAETVRESRERVDYFAAYEIVASACLGLDAYAANRRDVNDDAVDRVMRSFFEAYAQPEPEAAAPATFTLTLEAVDARAAAMSYDADPCTENRLASCLDAG